MYGKTSIFVHRKNFTGGCVQSTVGEEPKSLYRRIGRQSLDHAEL
jgi:hypothetical protein